jgi:hypothetical protein
MSPFHNDRLFSADHSKDPGKMLAIDHTEKIHIAGPRNDANAASISATPQHNPPQPHHSRNPTILTLWRQPFRSWPWSISPTSAAIIALPLAIGLGISLAKTNSRPPSCYTSCTSDPNTALCSNTQIDLNNYTVASPLTVLQLFCPYCSLLLLLLSKSTKNSPH